MIPRPLWKLISGIVVFLVVEVAGNSSGVDPTVTLVVAAAAAFGTIYLSAKIGF
jgi:hypothetical protein